MVVDLGHIRKFGDGLERAADFFHEIPDLITLLLGQLDVIDLAGDGMRVLTIEFFQFVIVAVEIAHDVIVERPFRVEEPPSHPHQNQRDKAADEEVKIAFNPGHNSQLEWTLKADKKPKSESARSLLGT